MVRALLKGDFKWLTEVAKEINTVGALLKKDADLLAEVVANEINTVWALLKRDGESLTEVVAKENNTVRALLKGDGYVRNM